MPILRCLQTFCLVLRKKQRLVDGLLLRAASGKSRSMLLISLTRRLFSRIRLGRRGSFLREISLISSAFACSRGSAILIPQSSGGYASVRSLLMSRELILKKLEQMKGLLAELERLLGVPAEEFARDLVALRAAERNFELIVETASDVNTQLLLEAGTGTPDTYKQSFLH